MLCFLGVSGRATGGAKVWGGTAGWENYWKEVVPETAVCRLRKITACQGKPPLPVNAETAVRRPPFLVDARSEKDEAGVRQSIEKKGETKSNMCVRKVLSMVGLGQPLKKKKRFSLGKDP